MTGKCSHAEALRNKVLNSERSPLSDDERRMLSNLSAGLGADIDSGIDAATSGDLGAMDLIQMGLKSKTLRMIGNMLTTVDTQDVAAPKSVGQSIAEDLNDLKDIISGLQQVSTDMISLIKEVSSLELPELGIDPYELGVEGVAGVVRSEVENVMGKC